MSAVSPPDYSQTPISAELVGELTALASVVGPKATEVVWKFSQAVADHATATVRGQNLALKDENRSLRAMTKANTEFLIWKAAQSWHDGYASASAEHAHERNAWSA